MSDRTNKFSARIGWGMTICVLFAGQKHSFSDKTQFHLSVQQDALIALRKRSGHLKSFTSIPQHETSSSLARQSSTELQTYFPSFFFVFCFFFKWTCVFASVAEAHAFFLRGLSQAGQSQRILLSICSEQVLCLVPVEGMKRPMFSHEGTFKFLRLPIFAMHILPQGIHNTLSLFIYIYICYPRP